jgi:hypothetical protein
MRTRAVIVVFLVPILTACASVFHGTRRRIDVFSEPAGATVSAGDQSTTTPGTLSLPRKAKSVEVRIAKDGYKPKTIRLVRKTSGAVWWNAGWILAGAGLGAAATQGSVLSGSGSSGDAVLVAGIGLAGVGFAVDYANGAAYRLEPATLAVRLEPEAPSPKASTGQ